MLDPGWTLRHVVLVGLMGVGKTSVGRELAARLGRELVDSDAQLGATEHATARELAATFGPDALHAAEAGALRAALARPEPAVIAAAAAAVVAPGVAGELAGRAAVVWLRAPVDVLAERVGAGDHRPFVERDPSATLAAMERERAGDYAAAADVAVDTADRTPAQVADAVLAALEEAAS